MSGGHLGIVNYLTVEEVAVEIERIIANNQVKDEHGYCDDYSPYTLSLLKDAAEAIRLASIYIHRVDYLVSGDDGQETFQVQLAEEISEHNKKTDW